MCTKHAQRMISVHNTLRKGCTKQRPETLSKTGAACRQKSWDIRKRTGVHKTNTLRLRNGCLMLYICRPAGRHPRTPQTPPHPRLGMCTRQTQGRHNAGRKHRPAPGPPNAAPSPPHGRPAYYYARQPARQPVCPPPRIHCGQLHGLVRTLSATPGLDGHRIYGSAVRPNGTPGVVVAISGFLELVMPETQSFNATM